MGTDSKSQSVNRVEPVSGFQTVRNTPAWTETIKPYFDMEIILSVCKF